MAMDVLFRADASVDIGTGHVMRCLTLADALRAAGASVRFVCRDLPGGLAHRIEARGFAVTLLATPASPSPASPSPVPPPAHAAWLPVTQETDAAQTLASGPVPDWIVVDHYALDARWETAVAGPKTGLETGLMAAPRPRVMAIDDLVDRPHAVTLLMDQTLGRAADAYGVLAPGARVLAGTRYALLRPEFAAARAASLAHTRHPVRNILVSLGGADARNVTGRILSVLDEVFAQTGVRVTVVMGGAAPHLDTVAAQAAALRIAAEVVVDVDDMADRMARADFSIGAAGGTTWERCCLGLPGLVVVLADNQSDIADAVAAAGAARNVGSAFAPGFADALRDALNPLSGSATTLATMSAAAAALCDGRGALRVLRHLLAATPDLRPARADDSRAVWDWRRAGDGDRYYRSGAATPFADHDAWWTGALTSERALLIAEYHGTSIGHLRLDPGPDGTTVSIVMAPAARGRGLARAVLEAGLRHAADSGVRRIRAEVHTGNTASVRLFEKAGFVSVASDGPFTQYLRDDPPVTETAT